MRNIKEIKKLLQQSLDLLPLEITSRHIRSHLEMAIKEIKEIEKIKFGKK
jgi:hypothetical protein